MWKAEAVAKANTVELSGVKAGGKVKDETKRRGRFYTALGTLATSSSFVMATYYRLAMAKVEGARLPSLLS